MLRGGFVEQLKTLFKIQLPSGIVAANFKCDGAAIEFSGVSNHGVDELRADALAMEITVDGEIVNVDQRFGFESGEADKASGDSDIAMFLVAGA